MISVINVLCSINLFFFMGAENHPWSQKLSEEVLTKSEFIETLKDELTIVPVVCSDELENKYKVTEFPTLVLADPSGELIYKTAYLPLEAKPFALHFKKVLKDYRDLKEALVCVDALAEEELEALYATSKKLGGHSLEVLEKALKKQKSPYVLLDQYAQLWRTKKRSDPELYAMRKKIEDTDPKNEKSTLLHLAMIEFKGLSSKLRKKENPLLAIRPLVEYLEDVKDPDNRWTIEMVMARYLMSKNRIKEARSHAESSLELAPEFAKAEIAETLNYLSELDRN